MPSALQKTLYAKLQKDFGDTVKWGILTTGTDFPSMNQHTAYHFLGLLIEELLPVRVGLLCGCTGKRVAFFDEAPDGGTPGASDTPAV